MALEASRTFGGGCLRGLAMQLGAMVLVVGLLGCCAGLGALLPVSNDLRPLAVGGGMMGGMMLAMVLAIGFGLWNRRRIAGRVDAAFLPLGLSGAGLLTIGRQYHGEVDGRRVDAYFNKGPTLEVYVAAATGADLRVGQDRQIARSAANLMGTEAHPVDDPRFEGLVVFAKDGEWADKVLVHAAVRDGLVGVMETDGRAQIRNFAVTPEALYLQVRSIGLNDITEDRVGAVVRGMVGLASALELAPPPAVPLVASAMQRQMRVGRSDFNRKIIKWTLAGFGMLTVVLTVCMVVALGVLFLTAP